MLIVYSFIFVFVGLAMSYEKVSDVPIVCATVFSISVIVAELVEELADARHQLQNARLKFDERIFKAHVQHEQKSQRKNINVEE